MKNKRITYVYTVLQGLNQGSKLKSAYIFSKTYFEKQLVHIPKTFFRLSFFTSLPSKSQTNKVNFTALRSAVSLTL